MLSSEATSSPNGTESLRPSHFRPWLGPGDELSVTQNRNNCPICPIR